MKIPLRMVLVALVALVAIGGLISTIPSDQISAKPPKANFETHSGFCGDESGASLVIDFGTSSNREMQTTCVKNFKGTGWQLFSAANVDVSGTDEFPTGFVCRIAGWPSRAVQPCTGTPTANQGTWAYFFASPTTDGKWWFSGQGAAMRKPLCGSVDGWRFIEPGEAASSSLPRVTPKTFSCK